MCYTNFIFIMQKRYFSFKGELYLFFAYLHSEFDKNAESFM